MTEHHVTGEKQGNIYYLTFNRPEKRNAISFEMLDEISKLVEPVIMDPEIRVIIKSAPLAVGAFKKIIKRGEGVDLMTHLDMEVSLQSIMIRSEDFQEGVNALVEGRDPQWKRK